MKKKPVVVVLSILMGVTAVVGGVYVFFVMSRPETTSSGDGVSVFDQMILNMRRKFEDFVRQDNDAQLANSDAVALVEQLPVNSVADKPPSSQAPAVKQVDAVAQRVAEAEAKRVAELFRRYRIERTDELFENRAEFNYAVERCKDRPTTDPTIVFISDPDKYISCVHGYFGGNFEDYSYPLTELPLQIRNQETNAKYDAICADIGGCAFNYQP